MADWSTRYLAALEARDTRESAHKRYIDAYSRLADRKSVAPTTIPSATPTTTDPNNDEITNLRTALTTTQAARSALSTQLTALQTSHHTLNTQHNILSTQLTSAHRQISALERRLKDREDELREKKKLVAEVQDEMVGLTMELNMLGEKTGKLEAENRELVQRWMVRMEGEAEKANQESGWR